MKIIGITGTLGAGKGTIVDFLLKEYGFEHYSARQFLIREIEKRNLSLNRDSMTMVANELRKQYTSSYIIDELLKEAVAKGGNAVIESIRAPKEIDSLKAYKDCYLFAVDADPKIRYGRIRERGSETDHVSFETFIQNEEREMTSDDPNKQNIKACIERADYIFNNDGFIEELQTEVKKVLLKLGIK